MEILDNLGKYEQQEYLLGGAALSISDIEIVESQEIKWLVLPNIEDRKSS